ncbi:hypothetical protein CY34DRAFT_810808 [Suillus luteus UH-Slu-Lm8-n1]|uniref:Uncharacterized protein n=1 Tax=Suillus luteus UH-Slu-Lm8-n1 TaxID=930992 RepID=A0A0D0ARY6_9AGAM|nr:hypothetical protein CY34DRAFT_810808 [Suillus luteus UH-Slu-Lm8-n1]
MMSASSLGGFGLTRTTVIGSFELDSSNSSTNPSSCDHTQGLTLMCAKLFKAKTDISALLQVT